MSKGRRRGDLARASKAMNKGSANVPALRLQRALIAQEERGLLKANVQASEVIEELARLGGVAAQTFLRTEADGVDVKLDPDEMHRRKLLAHRDMLAMLLKCLALPKSARHGLRQLIMDIHDFLDGRQSRVLTPMRLPAGRRADPLRDWIARATFAIMAERVKRQNPKGNQNDKDAYLHLLPRVDKELRTFGITVDNVLPGKAPKAAREGSQNEETKEEQWSRNVMVDAVAQRCVDHKTALDGGSDTVPSLARRMFEQAIADLDQAEKAGQLKPVSNDEIEDMAIEFRLSFDRTDYDRMLKHAATELVPG